MVKIAQELIKGWRLKVGSKFERRDILVKSQ
jgi:hypothetical protein